MKEIVKKVVIFGRPRNSFKSQKQSTNKANSLQSKVRRDENVTLANGIVTQRETETFFEIPNNWQLHCNTHLGVQEKCNITFGFLVMNLQQQQCIGFC